LTRIKHRKSSRARAGRGRLLLIALAIAALGLSAGDAFAQRRAAPAAASDLVTLDFNDVELSVVIDTIAQMTNTNFIYDDRVRGRVTIVSPTPMAVDQAYAVFESVLQVKGFTTVATPGDARPRSRASKRSRARAGRRTATAS
jgi:type II secretory pathway component GspD/PulD (secretin)